MTLQEFGHEVLKIREALNTLEVRGERNASLVVYCYNKCNDLVAALNEVIAEVAGDTQLQNGMEEASNEQDSGVS